MDEPMRFLDEFAGEKPESFQEEVFVPRRRRWQRLLFLPVLLILMIGGWMIYQTASSAVLPDMSEWQMEAIQKWVEKNYPSASLTGVYSDTAGEGVFIESDPASGTRLTRGMPLRVVYSKGANPSEPVSIPNLKGMTLDQVQTWIAQHHLSGATISFEGNELVAKDTVIQYELLDGTAEQFLRKSRVRILVSSGAVGAGEPFAMPDLTGKSLQEAFRWMTEKGVPAETTAVFDNVYAADTVIRQSIRKDTKITKKDAVALVISRGPAITIPDFVGMTRQEASELAALKGIKAFVRSQTSAGRPDTILSQDAKAGQEVDGKTVVTLVVSRRNDTLMVPDFKGLTGQDAEKLAALSGMKVFLMRNGNYSEKAVVVSQTVSAGKTVREDQLITLSLEPGIVVEIPDFVGMTREEASVLAQNLGLSTVLRDIRNTLVPNGTVLRQDILPGTAIGERKSLLLEVAVNSGVTAIDLTKGTKADAEGWAADNGLLLRFTERYHDSLPAGTLFEQTGIGELVPAGGSIVLHLSLGRPVVPDFVGKPKTDVLAWHREALAKGAKLTVTYTEDTGSTQAVGSISTQSIRSDDTSLNGSIAFGVSTKENSGVRIVSLAGMSASEASAWCGVNGIPSGTEERYAIEKVGHVISQSHYGIYLPKGEILKLVVSMGLPVVPSFTGQEVAAVQQWLQDANRLGAGLTLIIEEEWSDTAALGTLINQSVSGTGILPGTTLRVTLSKGADPGTPEP